MPQDPLLTDQIQIEPGSPGTRLINRDTGDGSLKFYDSIVTAGIKLSELAGLRSISQIYVVGVSGTGAEYTTIQSAVDAVPVTASLTDPALILVGPGVYSENVVIEKDGIWLVGLGGAVLDAAVADATITVQSSVSSDPNWCRIENLRIQNSNAGEECILISGGAGSVVGSSEISIISCDLVASGAGAYQVRGETVDNVRIHGGTFTGSATTSLTRFTNCAKVHIQGVAETYHIQIDYNLANPIPSLVTADFRIKDLSLGGNVLSNLTGTGSLTISSTSRFGTGGNLTFNGDGAGTFSASGGDYGSVTVNGSAPLTLKNSSRTSIAGAGTIAEDTQQGDVTFVASATEVVVFPVPHPDANYQVFTESELTEAISITSKTAAGFTVSFVAPQNTTVNYTAVRR